MEANIEEIVNALIKKTREGNVVWNLSSSKNEFKLQLKDSTICISHMVIRQNVFKYTIQIYNANGNVIVNQSLDGTLATNELRDLYKAANDSYFKKNETLQSILAQVNTEGKIGEDDSLPF